MKITIPVSVGVLIEAIKEQQVRIEELEKK